MNYAAFQFITITLVVLWSLAFAASRLFPRSSRAVQAKLAGHLSASSNAALQAVGAKLTPQQVASGSGCGSGGGCSSCGTCAPSKTAANDVHPLVFHPRAKR